MKNKILICILLFVSCFCFITNVEAANYDNYDTGSCIDNFGEITFKSSGQNNDAGGKITFDNKKNNLTWNTDPVSFDFTAQATSNQKIIKIRYEVVSKQGYSCKGIISGELIENNTGSVTMTVNINKGWVDEMFFMGVSEDRGGSNKRDLTESNNIYVRREMTDTELEEINQELEVGVGETLQCKTLQELLDKYWTWVMILAPVATMVLISIDFVGPILSGNSAEAMKKASDRTFKRAIALVILLMLPVIVNILFGLFGVETCF